MYFLQASGQEQELYRTLLCSLSLCSWSLKNWWRPYSTQNSIQFIGWISTLCSLSGGAVISQFPGSQVCEVQKAARYHRNTFSFSKTTAGGCRHLGQTHRPHQCWWRGFIWEFRILGTCMPVAANKEQCHVYLLDPYIKKVLSEALSKKVFYLCPVAKVSDTPESMWYTSVPVGKKQASDNAIFNVWRG